MSDSVGQYLNEIGAVALLNAQEERELSQIIERGVAARERIAAGTGTAEDRRLDRAAAQVGLERIRPLGVALPALNPARISMTDVSKVFTVIPFGADMSLMPERIRALPSL